MFASGYDVRSAATEAVDWAAAFPQSSDREALATLTRTWAALDADPFTVGLEAHAQAVTTLGGLVQEAHAATLHSAVPLWFAHAGVRCNSLLFELYHRTLHACERFLLATGGDVGGPCARPRVRPRGEPQLRQGRHRVVRQLLGAITLCHRLLAQPLGTLPPLVADMVTDDRLDQCAAYLRAYAFWNLALQRVAAAPALWCTETRADLSASDNRPPLAADKLDAAVRGLSEARRSLEALPQALSLADGAVTWPLPPFAAAPVSLEPLTKAEARAHQERLATWAPTAASGAAALQGVPWHQALPLTQALLTCELYLTKGERAWALPLARQYVRMGGVLPWLAAWELDKSWALLLQQMPTAAQVAALHAQPTHAEDHLREGDVPPRTYLLTDAPLLQDEQERKVAPVSLSARAFYLSV